MSELVTDCPRCGARQITFDLTMQTKLPQTDWRAQYETFCVCRKCLRATIFHLGVSDFNFKDLAAQGPLAAKRAANEHFIVETYISLKDAEPIAPPEHVPRLIAKVFGEAATCRATKCWNAAGTMFRLCVDLATRDLLPPEGAEGGPNAKQRRDLGLRLPWLFANGKLPEALHDLSTSIKEDGNDGAHQGTLTAGEAEDLLDFTAALLERLYTEPKNLELAKARRDERRAAPKQSGPA
jgi:hypothetical protein